MRLRVRILLMALVSFVPFTLSIPASASEYYCGAQCNGKSPNYVIPSNGIRCGDSKELIATGNPRESLSNGNYYEDSDLTVSTYYSPVCQTMWVIVSANSAHATPSYAGSSIQRTIATKVSYNVPTPSTGKSVLSVMVDDHSPSHGVAAKFNYTESYDGPKMQTDTYAYSSSY